MSRLDDMLANNKTGHWRATALLIMALIAGFLGWAYVAQLDEVAVAMGEVVPTEQLKVIQHLEGGIVERIDVREGDRVKKGQSLVQLDLASAGTNRQELQVRLDGLMLKSARLTAEAEQRALTFPQDEAQHLPALVAAERSAFTARKRELNSALSVLQKKIRQRELEVEELSSRKTAVAANLRLALERFRMSTSLLADGLTAKMDHLELEAEVKSLEGELAGLVPAIPRAKAAVGEIRERVIGEKNRFRSHSRQELTKVEQDAARVREILAQATDQGRRALIRSPIDGIVKNLSYHSVGGVVRPGDAIMELVPAGNKVMIEAKLNPIDRGYVRVGQKAVVKISTYDFIRYGGLDGQVAVIGADTISDPNGNTYYRVQIRTDKIHLGDAEGELPITPGMEATVDIHTGTKSVLDYLITPVLKLRQQAFRER